ncbi:uncharacterized mitochondrial protein AtMg00820-like [Lactuca sativa]|uniref:uncharacterized mitochondrial protein AtMg00820-like n=1 Tax=Lactuca sativa TaxID=4236 RepID=UPI0022B074F8|nr:uncharacterized mitochondrial protein AtMg00820-like [Lactuca sativa]
MEFCMFNPFISKIKPKTVKIALDHADWVQVMQEELNESERNKVWRLDSTSENASVVSMKWVFRNKMDKEGNVIRNKARLAVKGYCQEEGIDYKEIQSSKGIFINQEAYTKTLLAKFRMVGDSKVKIPMAFGMKLTPSLFHANPCELHMVAVKNIFRYLKRTTSLGIWYLSNSGFYVQAYFDTDLGGCGLDWKSTSGGYQFLYGKLVN